MRKKNIVAGALILTVAGIITRILGFMYRIYMSNIIGAEGIGLYQLIMPVYMLAWSISCSGFNTTISKLIAGERAKGEFGNMGRILKQSVMITSALGIILSISLYVASDAIAVFLLKDMRTAMSLRILSIAFPFMAAGTCVRGYFLGLQETLAPAINQVLEQCVRMITIYFLAGYFIPRGLEFACAVAVIGIVCEEIISFIYIFLSYRRFKSINKLTKRPILTPEAALSLIVGMALPLTANRVSASLLTALENILIPQRLQAYGMSASQAMSVFGRMSGMAMPLIYFPSALLVSLSITLVPAVSEAAAIKRISGVKQTISKSVHFACVTGFCAASLFLSFSNELGIVIYNQPIGDMLFIMGLVCPFLYMQIILSGILNGLGQQVLIFKTSLMMSFINILFIHFLVPRYGIGAFIMGWFVSLIFACALGMYKIHESIQIELNSLNWIVKPILAAAASGLSLKWFNKAFITPLVGSKLGLMFSVCFLALFYWIIIVLCGVIDINDLKRIIRRGEKVNKAAAI